MNLPKTKTGKDQQLWKLLKSVDPALALQVILSNMESSKKFKDTMFVVSEIQYKELVLEKIQVLDDAAQLKVLTLSLIHI